MVDWPSDRFLDVDKEPVRRLPPIYGYEKVDQVSLEKAVVPLEYYNDNVQTMARIAKQSASQPSDALSPDESAAVHLYTMEQEPNNIYTALNRVLRSEQRPTLRPWFLYLKLLLTALYKLPSIQAVVWRGIRADLSGQYKKDEVVIWWGFSSCTETISVLERFIGMTGKRTVFSIQCLKGKSIRKHSFYADENEILLMPGTYFKVVDQLSMGSDLCIIHLQEEIPPHPIIAPPFLQTGSNITGKSTLLLSNV
jgi:hypothetical protein